MHLFALRCLITTLPNNLWKIKQYIHPPITIEEIVMVIIGPHTHLLHPLVHGLSRSHSVHMNEYSWHNKKKGLSFSQTLFYDLIHKLSWTSIARRISMLACNLSIVMLNSVHGHNKILAVTLNLFLVSGWPGSGTTSMISNIKICLEKKLFLKR